MENFIGITYICTEWKYIFDPTISYVFTRKKKLHNRRYIRMSKNINVKKIVSEAIDLYSQDKYDQALALYKKALPYVGFEDSGILYYNIGLCHFSKMNYKAAEVSFKKSFNDYNYFHCGYELSMTLLFNHKLKEGLDMYKYRYYGERKSFPNLPIKQILNLSEAEGKKVLVLNEQGYGDEILFSRGIPKLCEFAKEIHYQVYDKMIDLFKENFTFDNIIYLTDRTLSYDFVLDFDCWIATGDIFSSYTKEYGMDYTPLKSNNVENDKLNIGLTWYANVKSGNSDKRSIDLSKLEPILNNDEIICHSLQYKDCPSWMIESDISDFKKTADLISKMDVVITVDTITAHLAGMMNKKVILIYEDYLDWRWNFEIYKNVEIIKISDLEETIKKVRN